MKITKIKSEVLPSIPRGEERVWQRCKKCGWTGYKHIIPYSFSGGFSIMGCGHDAVDKTQAENITEEQAIISLNDFFSSLNK